MTAQARYYFMVGLVSIMGIVGLIYGLMFLSGSLAKGRSIRVKAIFADANGLPIGGEVRLAGVDIGQVSDITVNDRKEAEVTLSLEKKYSVPKDSWFEIQGNVLSSASLLVIRPGSMSAPTLQDGDVVHGHTTADLNTLFAESQKLYPKLETTMASLERTTLATEKLVTDPVRQKRLDHTLANIEAITTNLSAATGSLPRISSQAQEQLSELSAQSKALLTDLDSAAISGKQIAKNGEHITADLQDTLAENRKTLRSLLQNADESASALAGLLNQAGGLINDPKIKANLIATTDNLASVTARMDAVTGNIQKLSDDPRLAADLRETVSNLKDTTASIRNVAGRVEGIHIPGEKKRSSDTPPSPPKPASSTSLIEPGLAFDSFYDTTQPRLRADVDYTLRMGSKGQFYRAGLYDLTESNKLNLQAGQAFGAQGNLNLAYRYGLFQGKFGLGLDTNLGPFDLRLEGYDPNRFTGNARAKFYLNRERTQSLLFGLDDFAHDSRATIGVQIRN